MNAWNWDFQTTQIRAMNWHSLLEGGERTTPNCFVQFSLTFEWPSTLARNWLSCSEKKLSAIYRYKLSPACERPAAFAVQQHCRVLDKFLTTIHKQLNWKFVKILDQEWFFIKPNYEENGVLLLHSLYIRAWLALFWLQVGNLSCCCSLYVVLSSQPKQSASLQPYNRPAASLLNKLFNVLIELNFRRSY